MLPYQGDGVMQGSHVSFFFFFCYCPMLHQIHFKQPWFARHCLKLYSCHQCFQITRLESVFVISHPLPQCQHSPIDTRLTKALTATLSPSLDTKVLLEPSQGSPFIKTEYENKHNETMSRTTPQLVPLNLTHRLTRTKKGGEARD